MSYPIAGSGAELRPRTILVDSERERTTLVALQMPYSDNLMLMVNFNVWAESWSPSDRSLSTQRINPCSTSGLGDR